MHPVNVFHVRAHLRDGEQVKIPYWQIDSGVNGPVFLVTAAQHGNEVQGSESARRLVMIAKRHLAKGTLIVFPFCNPKALGMRRPHITSGPEKPIEETRDHNMNRTWPGDPNGNDTQRMSHAIYSNIKDRVTHFLDIHCWHRFTAACALIEKNNPQTAAFSNISGLPFALVRPKHSISLPGSIQACLENKGKYGLVIELSGQYMIDEKQIKLGVQCATNMLHSLDMLESVVQADQDTGNTVCFEKEDMITVQAPENGLFVKADLAPSDVVKKGQILGHLIHEDNLAKKELFAPESGRLFSYGCYRAYSDVALPPQHPFAGKNDHIASIVPIDPV